MRLPANLLSQLRIGLSAGAVLFAGCDRAEPAAAAPEAASAEAADASASDAQPAAEPVAPPATGISGAVARAVEGTRTQPSDPPPLLDEEDSTAVIPFAATPGSRVRPRAEAPLAFAAPAPRTKRRPKPAPLIEDEPCGTEPVGTKSTWQCGPCGRG